MPDDSDIGGDGGEEGDEEYQEIRS